MQRAQDKYIEISLSEGQRRILTESTNSNLLTLGWICALNWVFSKLLQISKSLPLTYMHYTYVLFFELTLLTRFFHPHTQSDTEAPSHC